MPKSELQIALNGFFISGFLSIASALAAGEWRLAPDQVATYFIVLNVSGLVFGTLLPFLSDNRCSPRSLLLFSLLSGALTVCLMSLVSVLGWPYWLSAVSFGPITAVNGICFGVIKSRGGSTSEISRARGIFTGTWVLGPLVTAGFFALGGATGISFYFMSILVVGLIVAMSAERAAIGRVGGSASIRTGDGIGRLIWVYFSVVFLQAAANLGTVIVGGLVVNDLSESESLAPVVAAAQAFVEIFFLFLYARLDRVLSREAVLILGCAAGLVYFYRLGIVGSVSELLVLQLFAGAFVAAAKGVALIWLMDALQSRPGLAAGLFGNANRVGAIVTTLLLPSFIGDSSGYRSGAMVGFFAIVLGVMGVAGRLRMR